VPSECTGVGHVGLRSMLLVVHYLSRALCAFSQEDLSVINLVEINTWVKKD